MCNIVETLILLPDGSESLFFKYFEPRVLPNVPLEPLLVDEPCTKITIVHGGEEDWVDKTGSTKISLRFPGQIRLVTLP